MSSDESQRAALLALLGRKLAGEHAVKTVLFQQAIADQLGLNTTDLMCLSFLGNAVPLTAGQLAEATGLTTGSVTVLNPLKGDARAMIKRLPHLPECSI
jgi:hypothetical protein